MNPWNQFLEALHSALIDELVELHPEPKPELGMPVRASDTSTPAPGLDDSATIRAALDQSFGLVLLMQDSESARSLGRTANELIGSALTRAQPEFSRRGIAPCFDAFSKGSSAEPSKVIWFPFVLGRGRCYLGIGI